MANKIISDLLGTALSKFQLGITGPALKNNTNVIEARNNADSAYILFRALGIAVTGDTITYNEQASSSGASWKFKLSRPSTGMTHDLEIILPSGDPSVGQALTVASFTSNVITLQWTTIASGAEKMVVDTTSLAFGTTSPLAMYTAPANAVQLTFQVIIDTQFTGAPSLSIGITGTTSKYMSSTQVDLTQPAGTIFEVTPGIIAVGTTENIIATYSAGGAAAGAARILGFYAIPA